MCFLERKLEKETRETLSVTEMPGSLLLVLLRFVENRKLGKYLLP